MIVTVGMIVGLILGLMGAGGSVIAVPLLVFTMRWDVAHAAPIALIAVAAAALLGTLIGLRHGVVRYRAAAMLSAFGILAAPLGFAASHRLPAKPITLAFSALLLFVAWRMHRQTMQAAALSIAASPPPCMLGSDGRLRWTSTCARTLGLSGAVSGFLSGLLGVGGGFIIVPTLKRATNLTMDAIVATSLMSIALVSSAALVISAASGHLDLVLALPFAVGASGGMLLGRAIARRVSGAKLQRGFAMLAAAMAVGLVIKTLTS